MIKKIDERLLLANDGYCNPKACKYELLFVLSELNTDQTTTTINYNYYRVTTIQVDVKKQGLRCPAVEVYFQTFFFV